MDTRSGLLGTPLGQFGLGAIALVIGGMLLFTLIGAVSADDDDGDPTAAPTTDAADTEASTAPPTDTATDGDATTDGGTDAPTDPAPTGTETDTATEPPPTEPQFEPAEISVQVLDAVGDGGATHGAILDCLEQAGYDDLIPNSASRIYTETTVFFTAGEENQAMAQQVASTISVASVEEKPANLSDSVPVHVVVGEDGGDLC